MNKQEEQLEAIRDIRSIMEKSARFLSLSGLAGVIIGLLAIISIAVTYCYLGLNLFSKGYYQLALLGDGTPNLPVYTFLLSNFGLVLLLSIISGIVMSFLKAKKLNLTIWDAAAKRLLINIAIPLFAGGLYALILLYHQHIALIAPVTLIFYGLALINASRYTINDIRYLGIIEVVVGLLASIFIDYGLLFWAFGFGILHVVYGIVIYLKYEQ
jgi:hypothetical protein